MAFVQAAIKLFEYLCILLIDKPEKQEYNIIRKQENKSQAGIGNQKNTKNCKSNYRAFFKIERRL